MRIVTWNCYRGECRQRAAQLDVLAPDIVVLQECGKPTEPTDERCVWFGSKPKQGVATLTRGEWTVAPGPLDPEVPDSAYPVRVSGPIGVNVLTVWTQPHPTHARALNDALERYHDFLLVVPSIVIGDFNNHPRWDQQDRNVNHSTNVELLKREFGLVSAYHAAAARTGSAVEDPTLDWQWRQNQPYHIDYCFIPELWVPHLTAVEVGGYGDWESAKSDHRPLVVDLDLPA